MKTTIILAIASLVALLIPPSATIIGITTKIAGVIGLAGAAYFYYQDRKANHEQS